METIKKGATTRQIIDTLVRLCTVEPSLLDKPVIVDRPIIDAQEEGEFFAIGTIEVIGGQISFGA